MPSSSGPGDQDQPRAAWGAIPARAIADKRMTATHFRVLAAIALHDRLSVERGKGAGCWASNKTLAAETGVNYTNLSTAITELGTWGLIERGQHPLNKKQHVYRVIYDPLPQGEPSPLPMGKSSEPQEQIAEEGGGPNTLPSGEQSSATVCPAEIIPPADQGDKGEQYIPPKREYIPLKRETYSPEGAPPLRIGAAPNEGGFLAIVERALREGGTFDSASQDEVQRIRDSTEPGDPLHHQAERILETWAA